MGPTPPQLDPAGRLAGDHPCTRCNYNLRGLAPAATCPECGRPVSISTTGNLLCHADPQWLGRLLRGPQCALGSIVTFFGCWVMSMIRVPADLVVLFFYVCPILAILGIVQFTAPQPNIPPEDRHTARQATRSACFVFVFTALIGVFDMTRLNGVMSFLLFLFATVAANIGVIALGRHAAALAERIPDAPLASSARRVGLGMGIALIPAILGSGVFILSASPFGIGRAPALLMLASIAAIGAFIILGIRAVILMVQFGEALRRAEEFSRGFWRNPN